MNKEKSHILFAEDESDAQTTTVEYLSRKFDIIIDTVDNGLDAFLAAQDKKYDLIITDHKMPFMTGAAFAVACRTKETKNGSTPIIILSGYMSDEMKRDLGLQSTRFVMKPCNFEELGSIIESYLVN